MSSHGVGNGRSVQTVLVVDDEVAQADALAMLLQLEGFDIEIATSGPQALFRAGKARPDAIVMDIGMPGMSGIQVARELSSRGYAGIRLIALTGYGDDIDRLPHRRPASSSTFLSRPTWWNCWRRCGFR